MTSWIHSGIYWPLLWFKERLYKREASTITVGKKENAYCRVQLANFKQLQIAWEELVGLEPGQEKGMKKLSVEEMTFKSNIIITSPYQAVIQFQKLL